MSYLRISTTAAIVAALSAWPDGLAGQAASQREAQPSWADSAPARIIASARGGISLETVLEILRQRHKAYPEAKRRELADLVVARAIDDPHVGRVAILAVSMSGSSDPRLGGVPDPEALNRLIRIQQTAKNAGERGFALTELAHQINPSRALPFLRQLATSTNDRDASAAVSEISRVAYSLNTSLAEPAERSQAEVLLRELYDKNLVKGRGAIDLCEIAIMKQWPRAARCRGIM